MNDSGKEWVPNKYISMVGKNIKKIRKQKKLTQNQLAARLSVSRSYICQLEYGIKVSKDTVEKLADALGVPLEELFKD